MKKNEILMKLLTITIMWIVALFAAIGIYEVFRKTFDDNIIGSIASWGFLILWHIFVSKFDFKIYKKSFDEPIEVT